MGASGAQRTFEVVSYGLRKLEDGPLTVAPGENPTSSKSSRRSLSPGWNGPAGAQKPGPGMLSRPRRPVPRGDRASGGTR